MMQEPRIEEFFGRLTQFISSLHTVEADLAQEAYSTDFTALQHRLFEILFLSEARNLSSLSDCLGINLPNCSREVRKLSEAGMVEKVRSGEDRRITLISLSATGREYTAGVMKRMMEVLLQRSGGWDEQDLETCTDAISVLEECLISRVLD